MEKSESNPVCMIDKCEDTHLIRQIYDAVWVALCLEHTNRLVNYIARTQQHEEYLIAHASYLKAMSPYPSGTGMTGDADAISESIRLENIMRDFINGWLADPSGTERDFFNDV